MKLKTAITLISGILIAPNLIAHTEADNGTLRLDENRKERERKILQVPDIKGYTTLKCDLHMHTVFSDGLVWPAIRIQEAWQEGLDAIAITDHIEYQPHKNDIPTNHNRPYELTKEAAEMTNIILIQGSEITRDTPPGHFNAIYINDSSLLVEEKAKGDKKWQLDKQAIDAAADQGAFIFWNHPGWKVDSVDGSYEWIDFVDEIRKEGKLHGIEVINGFKYHRKSLDWAIEHDLAVLGTSDIHNLIAHDYDMEKGVTRSMSLVFAKERTAKGIREALEAGRSVAWATNILAGREKWVRALYDAAVTVGEVYDIDGRGNAYAEISNSSDLYFKFELDDPKAKGFPQSITLNPRTTQVIRFKHDGASSAKYTVTNAYIGGYENLVVEVKPAS